MERQTTDDGWLTMDVCVAEATPYFSGILLFTNYAYYGLLQ